MQNLKQNVYDSLLRNHAVPMDYQHSNRVHEAHTLAHLT